jgi:hypothetical protein
MYLRQTTRPFNPSTVKGDISSLCIHIVFVHLDLIDDTIPSLLVHRYHRFTRVVSCLYCSLPLQIP